MCICVNIFVWVYAYCVLVAVNLEEGISSCGADGYVLSQVSDFFFLTKLGFSARTSCSQLLSDLSSFHHLHFRSMIESCFP